MEYAEVIEKKQWHEGMYPADPDQTYRTRQIVFVTDDGQHVHINVSSKHRNSMKFNDLKIGDRICGFYCLKDSPIIHPDSEFRMYSKNALF